MQRGNHVGGMGTYGGRNKLKERIVVNTSTRFAKDQRRIVTRTARLRPDGPREVVAEKNSVV